jgi:hypothetical protein
MLLDDLLRCEAVTQKAQYDVDRDTGSGNVWCPVKNLRG